MSDPNAGARFFGYVLMAVGALIVTLCGGCTVYFFGTSIWTSLSGARDHGGHSGDESVSGIVVAFISIFVGGLPTAAGVALFFAGAGMKRRANAPPGPDSNTIAR